jgi:O-antigen ligase/tetratricopeptide (TPR) repeat protein
MTETAATSNTQEAGTYPSSMDQTHNTPVSPAAVVRIREPDKLGPLHVVMIFLATAVVAGGCLLLSAPESTTLVDGALAWSEESPLRAVVQLLCLNYGAPTLNPGDVKNYIMGVGTGLAILAIVVGVLSRTRCEDETTVIANGGEAPMRRRLSSLAVAQLLVAMFLLWSFASSRWSRAPSISVGATTLLSIQFLWSFALGAGLSRAAARIVTRILVGVLALTAAIAVWYYNVRNPVLSAKFPFGNPIFLATCLLAGMIPAVVFVGDSFRSAIRRTSRQKTIAILASLVSLAFCLWAFQLTGSRGPAVGLLFGVLAVVFFSLHGWRKWIPLLLGVGVSIAGWMYLTQQADTFSSTGRSATIRFRLAGWQHAWGMFTEKPITGHGQGGFVLIGDTLIGDEILDDPLPFVARLTHAHNEWLETLCDLGVVGLVLIGAALLLTFHAGIQQIRSGLSGRTAVALIGVMSALVAMIVAESFGVGLRVTGVPTIFFTLLGLTWALSASPERSVVATCSRTSRRRMAFGVVGGLIGLVSIAASQQDFSAARSAFQSGELVASGKMNEAADAAALAVLRLNPVRVLSNRSRLVEVHVIIAESHVARGVDRDRRSAASDPPDERLAALATRDYQLADEHSRIASLQLKELVSRAPEFIGTGRLEFRINLVRAQNEVSRGDRAASVALLKNAAAALERDMARRPFEPVLVTDYLRVALDWLSVEDAITKLARPLRHHRLADAYVSVLQHFSSLPDVDKTLASVAQGAMASLNDDANSWAPEKLRIIAAIRFLKRDFDGAIAVLRPASKAYDKLASSAPLGASACYAELADATFYADLLHPDAAIEMANHAIELAPQSQQGRALRFATERRLIQYLLAGGDEIEAVSLIRSHAPGGVSETDVKAEHGRRIRMLLDAMRAQYHETLRANDPDSVIVSTYRRLVARGLKLNPTDPGLHYLAADLAVLDKNPAIAARALESALRHGLPLEEAALFLEAAAKVLPESEELKRLGARVAAAQRDVGTPANTPRPAKVRSRDTGIEHSPKGPAPIPLDQP